MDPEKRKVIAAMGGRAAHQAGTAHKWTVATARAAGQKGGRGRKRVPAEPVTPANHPDGAVE